MQYGGAVQPMLDFELRPVGARRNWKNVLNKQRYEATLTQHRDATPSDNLGEELTQALRRTIERQIEEHRSLTPNSTVHFTLQSRAFTHAFQSTTFTVREFEEDSERLDTYLQSLAAKLNCNEEFTPDETLPWRLPSSVLQVVVVVTVNATNPAKPLYVVSPKSRASPSKTKTNCVVHGPSSP